MPIRTLFVWKYSGVLVPFFFGTGYAAMTYHQFSMGYFLSVLGGIWTWGYYFYSDSRKKRLNRVARLRDAARKHASSEKVISKFKDARAWHYFREFGTFIGVFSASGAFILWLSLGQENYELSLLEGKLYPAKDPTPSNVCMDKVDDGIIVFLGSNAAVIKTFPFTLLKVKGEKILIVDKQSDGSLAITLDVFGKDGRIVARITDGQFVINPNNLFVMRRKDRSSLQVVDQYGTQVLNMRYLNRQAMWIDVVLYSPGLSQPIILDGSRSPARNCGLNIWDALIAIP